jgi:putative ABC transport system permease protein
VSYLSRKLRRDIRRQKWQFLAVGITVAIGVMMFAAAYDSYRNLTVSYGETYDRLAFADMTITGGDDGLSDALTALAGVRAVSVRHSADLPITIGSRTLRGRLVGMPAPQQPDVNKIDVEDGTYLMASGDPEAVAEIHVADTLALQPGDTFTVVVGPDRGIDFTIVGTAASPEYLWPAASTQEAFVDPEQFGVFFVDDGLLERVPPSVAVTETLVLYDTDVDTAAIDSAVRSAAISAGATSILSQADHPSNSSLQLDVDGFQQMSIAFPILFLTAAGMAMYVLLARTVFSQRAIIGTLRASGMSPVSLRRHYLGFGLWVGAVASVFGVIFGAVLGAVMTSAYTSALSIPDTVVSFRPLTILVGIVFGIGAGALSALIPARSAYRIAPAEAMRGEAPMMSGDKSVIEKAIPALSALPVRTRMTIRGIGRAKRRSFSTVLGVVLALVLILASGLMIDSMINVVNQWFNEISIQDADVVASRPVDDQLLVDISAVDGVAAAERVASLGVSITRDGDTFATSLQAFEAGTVMHGWTNPSGSLPPSGVLAGAGLADRLGVSLGDRLTIDIPTLDTSIVLDLVGFVDEPLGIPMYVLYGVLRDALAAAGVSDPDALMAEPYVTTAMTRFDETGHRSATIAAIAGVPGGRAVQDATSLYDLLRQFLSLFYVFGGFMLVFGGVMAYSLMFNTVSMNVSERSTEFAALKASGMSDRTIAWMLAGENLLLTAIGIVPGILLGMWVSGKFIESFNNDAFTFSLSVRPLTIVVAGLSMFVVALLSLIPGIRSVRRLDIGKVIRERAV